MFHGSTGFVQNHLLSLLTPTTMQKPPLKKSELNPARNITQGAIYCQHEFYNVVRHHQSLPRGSSVDGGSSERLQLLTLHPHLEEQEAKNNLDLVKKEKVIQHPTRRICKRTRSVVTLNLASRPQLSLLGKLTLAFDTLNATLLPTFTECNFELTE